MAILKLKDVGDSHTMQITGCRVVKGQYGEQVEFTGKDGNTIFVGREPADRQLARCGYDFSVQSYDDVTDSILTFAREANTTKKGAAPFWSITLAGKADLAPKAPPRRLAGPPSDSEPPEHHRTSGVPDSPPQDRLEAAMAEVGIVEEAEQAKAEHAAKVEHITTAYLALYDRVAAHLCTTGRANDFPVDAAGINAATASIFIALDKKNLV